MKVSTIRTPQCLIIFHMYMIWKYIVFTVDRNIMINDPNFIHVLTKLLKLEIIDRIFVRAQ